MLWWATYSVTWTSHKSICDLPNHLFDIFSSNSIHRIGCSIWTWWSLVPAPALGHSRTLRQFPLGAYIFRNTCISYRRDPGEIFRRFSAHLAFSSCTPPGLCSLFCYFGHLCRSFQRVRNRGHPGPLRTLDAPRPTPPTRLFRNRGRFSPKGRFSRKAAAIYNGEGPAGISSTGD